MKMRGKLSYILVEISPEAFGPYITYENLKPVLYQEWLKALYGMLIALLLFYWKLIKGMEAIGFKVNHDYPWVANKMIWNKQMTITWHVYDFKVSHDYNDIVDNSI